MSRSPPERRALKVLRERVDRHFGQAVARRPQAFSCRRGCAECCQRRFSVFEIEAMDIRRALSDLDRNQPVLRRRIREQARLPGEACPLLVDDVCSVYDARPLICRSHGLPVVSPTGEVDWCHLNFQGHPVPAESLLRLEAINAPLAVAASMADPSGTRVALTDLARGD